MYTEDNFLNCIPPSHHIHVQPQNVRSLRDVVQEGAQWRHALVTDVLELHHQMVPQLLVNDSHRERAGFVGQEIAIIRGL